MKKITLTKCKIKKFEGSTKSLHDLLLAMASKCSSSNDDVEYDSVFF